MSAIDELLPIPPQPEISEGNKVFHEKAYALYKWMRTKLGPAIIEVSKLMRNAVTGAFTATSTTSMAITVGEKSLTISPGRSFMPGTPVRVARTSDPENYLDGITKTYDMVTGAFVFDGVTPNGSDTFSDWSISIIPSSGGGLASLFTNKFTGLQSFANEVTIASATTIDVTAAGSNQFKLTGVEVIEAVTMPQGAPIKGRVAGTPTLKNSATLIVQGGADYVCEAKDKLSFIKDADGNVHVTIQPYGQLLKLKTAGNDSTFSSNDGSPISADWLLGRVGLTRHGITSFSSPYTPASGEILARSHGLSVTPKSCVLIMECVIADAGYSVGDRCQPTSQWNGSNVFPIGTFCDSTNVSTTKCGAAYVVSINNKTTGAAQTPASNAWKYCFEYRF